MATTRSFDLATMVSSNGKIQGSSVAGGSAADATANIHADPSALPTNGNQTGDMAFVQSTNNVMIWDGSSWKTIANVTNTTPNIAGGSALTSYILAKDGTPTVVTINATESPLLSNIRLPSVSISLLRVLASSCCVCNTRCSN